MTYFICSFLLGAALTTTSQAGLHESVVNYQDGAAEMEGFHVYDEAISGVRPAVLIVHQWTGLSEYEKRRSRELASMGYNVFALDIYGKGIRPQPPAAGQEAGKYKGNRELYRSRLFAGLDILKKEAHTDATKIAAIGYCFGGTGALELARAGVQIVGVVSFHGGLDTTLPAVKGKVPAKILVLHGADDPYVPATDLANLETELRTAAADWQLVKYSGAVHAFTQKEAGNDPSKGAAYNEAADRRSWQAMKDFFAEIFSNQ